MHYYHGSIINLQHFYIEHRHYSAPKKLSTIYIGFQFFHVSSILNDQCIELNEIWYFLDFFLEMLKLFEDATFASFLSKQTLLQELMSFWSQAYPCKVIRSRKDLSFELLSKLAEVNKHVPRSNAPDSQYDQWNASDQIGNKEAPILSQIILEDLNICFLFIWTITINFAGTPWLEVLYAQLLILFESTYSRCHGWKIVIPQGAGLQGLLRIQWYRQP